MPRNIFGDWMDPNASIFATAAAAPTAPPSNLPPGFAPAPASYFQGSPQGAPPAASAPPARIPLPLPPTPLSLAPPNPGSLASVPAFASAPSAASPFGGLGAVANGFGSGIGNAISAHPLTLMALGAGIAKGGVGEGLQLAQAAAQAERNLMAQQVNYRQTYDALTGAGVPSDEALAAVANPSLMRALAVKYLGPKGQGSAAGVARTPTANSASNPAAFGY